MSYGAALLLMQEVTNVYQQPSYFIPIFIGLLLIGLVMCLVAIGSGLSSAKKTGKAAYWLVFASIFLLLYFLQWFAFPVAIAKQNMTITWGLASLIHLPIVLAVACVLIALSNLKPVGEEIVSEEV